MRVRSRPSAPARTTGMSSGIATELLDDRRDVFRAHALPVPMVDGHDRRPAASPQALDGAKRHGAVLGGLADVDAQLALERFEDALRALQPTAHVRADLDHVPADGLEVVHVVEGSDRLAVGRRQTESIAYLLERLGRKPTAVLLLRQAERRHDRGALVRVLRGDLADLLREAHARILPGKRLLIDPPRP